MARYRLLAPHHLEIGHPRRTPTLLEAGTEIDTSHLPPGFKPTPLMEPLDEKAYAALKKVCDEIREANGPGTVPAVGPLHRHPGGDMEGKDL